MKFQVLFACRTMINYLAVATNSRTNFPAEKRMMFFGAFVVPASKVRDFEAPAPLPEQNSLGSITESEAEANNEVCHYLTPKGMDGKTFALPSKSRCTRRCTPKKMTKVNHTVVTPQVVNKKRTLQAYQDELVTE